MFDKINTVLKKSLSARYKKYKEKKLLPGEKGLGKPTPIKPFLNNVGKNEFINVCFIGLGTQGYKQAKSVSSIPGINIVGLIDNNIERQKFLKENFDSKLVFNSLEEFFNTSDKKSDVVSIGTTAPYHCDIAIECLKQQIKFIIIEKPLDTSLEKSKVLIELYRKSNSKIIVNYSRRWSIDYQGIQRILDKKLIGEIHNFKVIIGKGELAMIGSHFFDLMNFLLNKKPIEIYADLERKKGDKFTDCYGKCFIHYEQNIIGEFDFASGYNSKVFQLIIYGTKGYIFIDENNMFWKLKLNNNLVWDFKFLEPIRSEVSFPRTITNFLNTKEEKCNLEDGLESLKVIATCFLSSESNRREKIISEKEFDNFKMDFR